jgi:hypothetical protein
VNEPMIRLEKNDDASAHRRFAAPEPRAPSNAPGMNTASRSSALGWMALLSSAVRLG